MRNSKIFSADIKTCLIINKLTNKSKHIPIMIGIYNISHDSFIEKVISIDFISLKNNKKSIETLSNEMLNAFFDYLDTFEDYSITLYFHNRVNFDRFFLLNFLHKKKYKYEVNTITRDNKLYKIEIKHIILKKYVTILDSYLIIPFSLNNASLFFNGNIFERIDENKYLTLQCILKEDSFDELQKYLINNLHVIYELIKAVNSFFLIEFNTSILKSLTLASLAQKIFIDNYLEKLITLGNNQDNFIRAGYLGSIIDVYKPFAKNIVVLDYNSMFANIMRNSKFSLDKPTPISNITDLEAFCRTHIGFLKCFVTCKPGLKYPLITIKYNDSNIQPTGQFVAIIYTKEILYCIENYPAYYQFEVSWGYYYNQTDYIFRDFITECLKKRQRFISTKDTLGLTLMKNLLNSFYGRWGINPKTKNLTITEDIHLYNTINNSDNISRLDKIDGLYYIETDSLVDNLNLSKKLLKSRVDWAAITTAEVRIQMQRLKDLVDVIYTDTDSIVIKSDDLKKIEHFIDQHEPGKLKVVGSYDIGIFINAKTYILKNKKKYDIKLPGIKRDAIAMSDFVIYKWFKSKKVKADILSAKNKKKSKLDAYYVHDYSKREKIYENNKWVNTKPLNIVINQHKPKE